jgi:hypothetical protein
VEKAVRDRPQDPTARLDALKLLIEDRATKQLPKAVRSLVSLQPNTALVEEAAAIF